jgi:WD40 repeat protein
VCAFLHFWVLCAGCLCGPYGVDRRLISVVFTHKFYSDVALNDTATPVADMARARSTTEEKPPQHEHEHAAAQPQHQRGSTPYAQLNISHTCSGHGKAVSGVRFAPNGRLLASVSADCSLRLWRVKDGGEARTVADAHTAGLNDVAWSPSAAYLATASDDLSARLWDAETGACLMSLAGHTSYVFCCQFDPAGHILVRIARNTCCVLRLSSLCCPLITADIFMPPLPTLKKSSACACCCSMTALTLPPLPLLLLPPLLLPTSCTRPWVHDVVAGNW